MATPTMHGFDVSHWNPTVTLNRDALIPDYPLMSCKATEGASYRDPTLPIFWDLFKKNNAQYRTAYHWIRSSSSIAIQVQNFMLALKSVDAYSPQTGLERGVFIQLDWETTPGIPPCTVAQVEEWQSRVFDLVGPRVMTYASDWVPGFLEWRQRNPSAPLWYANYNLGDGATGGAAECRKYDAAIWQFTSRYPVPGFLAGIDGNEILKFDTVIDVAGLTPPKPTLPIAPPPPNSPQEDDDDMLRQKVLVRHVNGQMYATDMETEATPVAEDVGTMLRDRRGFAVYGDERGPWPLDELDSRFVESLATKIAH